MRSMVEGLVGRRLCYDVGDRGCHVVEDELRRDADDMNVLSRQPRVAHRIFGRALAAIMRLAIDFDREPCRGAIEVENKLTGRML